MFVAIAQGYGHDVNNTSFKQPDYNRMACALFGAAVGDALGRVTEFIPSKVDIYNLYPHGVNWLDDIERISLVEGKQGYPYTDDTVMALIVVEELEENYHQPEKAINGMAHRFVDLFDPQKMYAIDPLFNLRAHGVTNSIASREIGKLFKQGKSWQDREKTFEKIKAEGGCGSVMRAWPIGFFYADDIERALCVADMQSCLTHRHPMARAACAAIAVGFAMLCNGQQPNEVAHAMINAADRYAPEEALYKRQCTKISDVLEQNLLLIQQDRLVTSDMLRYAYWAAQNTVHPNIVLGLKNDQQSNHRSRSGALLGWAADEAAAAALYIFLRHKNNFFEAISEAVNTPGDSDSIASLVGAFSAYLYGSEDLFKRAHAFELEGADLIVNFKQSHYLHGSNHSALGN